ncbi:response regulator transcription factor [soil metagenome]
MIRVVIADDQSLVRSGMRSLLEGEVDIEVVEEAPDGRSAVYATLAHKPHVVLMDIRMPVMDGLTATRQLIESGSDARVLILTTFDLDEYVFEALRSGASGLLLKDSTAEELVNAIRVLAAGEALLDPTVTRRVIDAFVKAPATPERADLGARLTERELEVLRLVAGGLSNSEIASKLYISHATVKSHVSSVLSKLNLRDRIQAVICAYENGLVQP